MKKHEILTISNPQDYLAFVEKARQAVISTRIQGAQAASRSQMGLYWWLGEHIANAQTQFGWGNAIVTNLSKDLAHLFPNTSFGFSPRNLWDMRRFYLEYRDQPQLRQLVAEIPWGQNLVILQKVKEIPAREYYLQATKELGWTRAILELQIQNNAYERQVLDKKSHNFHAALPEHLAEQAEKTLKSVYMLDTLGLTQPVLEAQIEAKMVEKIKNVLLELGYGFAFIGNQYRVMTPSGKENFIDLLFANRKLRCLVALELKVGKFKPEYAGKMNYYLNLLDDFVKEEGENPSIGIILCTSKDHIEVEYALRGIDKPVGVSEYQLTRDLPQELNDKLPPPSELEAQLWRELQEASYEKDEGKEWESGEDEE